MFRTNMETDVLVVGAGASGIPAAIGAARAGSKVILIEEDFVVGGATTDYYVDMLCGGPICGVIKEVEDILKSSYSLADNSRFYLPASFERAFRHLLDREKNITTITGARASGVIMKGSRVAGVKVNDSFEIRAKATVDATGSGAIALMAGGKALYGTDSKDDFGEIVAPNEKSLQVQQCTWMYLSQMLAPDGKPFDMTKLEHIHMGVMTNGAGFFHKDPEKAMRLKPQLFLHWGCAVECEDTRDPVTLGKAQHEALNAMERDHALLRENGYAIYLAPKIGVREQSRIVGRHTITLQDLCSGVLPEDTIAVGTYGIDVWGGKEDLWGGSKKQAIKVSGYGIPYRALLPECVDGLLVVGKAISGTHVAMSAYRVMPIVGPIGQAGGVAAALCSQTGAAPQSLDPCEVREVLRKDNQNVMLELKNK